MQDFDVKGFLAICAAMLFVAWIVLTASGCTFPANLPVPKPDESQLWRTVK